MKPDGMIVEPECVAAALEDVSSRGSDALLTELVNTEPALAAFVSQNAVTIAGKLALSGAPTEVVSGVHGDVLTAVLTSIQALRRGHFQIWKDTMTDTRMEQLDPCFRSKQRRRGKKNQTNGTEQDVA
jgi:hypothetical protein